MIGVGLMVDHVVAVVPMLTTDGVVGVGIVVIPRLFGILFIVGISVVAVAFFVIVAHDIDRLIIRLLSPVDVIAVLVPVCVICLLGVVIVLLLGLFMVVAVVSGLVAPA